MDSQQSSPPQKRAKIDADVIAETDRPTGGEQPQQQPTNSKDDGIFNLYLPSEEESKRTPEENLESNSASLKSSQTVGVWHKSLEESHSARIKEKSLLGHLLCPERTQKKILESNIFRILRSEGITGIGALHKVSPSKFVLVFRSQMEKEKLQNTVIQKWFWRNRYFCEFL